MWKGCSGSSFRTKGCEARLPVIASFEDLVAVCKEGARRDTEKDPDGVQWSVQKFEREQKPESHWNLCEPPFQIQKTYCLEVTPYDGKYFNNPVLRDLVFSDLARNARTKPWVVTTQKDSIADRVATWLLWKQELAPIKAPTRKYKFCSHKKRRPHCPFNSNSRALLTLGRQGCEVGQRVADSQKQMETKT